MNYPSRTTVNARRLGSLQITSRVPSANGESTWRDRRAFRLLARSIPETAAVVIGSLGRDWRLTSSKLGHIVWRVASSGGTVALWRLGRPVNLISMVMVLGERNKGMKGTISPVADRNSRVLRFGNKGSSIAQLCRAENTSKDTERRALGPPSHRILRAYFRK